MVMVARWAVVWKNLDSGTEGVGEGLFQSKEEALEFARLVGKPDTMAAGASVIFDATMVMVDTSKPLIGQVLEQMRRQQAEAAERRRES